MIRLTKKAASPSPAVLNIRGLAERQVLEARYDANDRVFNSDEFNKNIYAHDEVKDSLILLQDWKCAFCESKIGHTGDGDVEHFRPKAAWVQDAESLNRPGYYWLAYDWNNLVLSCLKCNQRHKKNFFPLSDPNSRARSHHDDISNETPLFVHPVFEDPEAFISFKDEIPVGLDQTGRGLRTIKQLAIDRETLNEVRRSELSLLRALYRVAKLFPKVPKEDAVAAWQEVKKIHDECLLDSHQFSSMYRAFFKANPLPNAI